MRTNIISENISSTQFIELREYMQNCLEESIHAAEVESYGWYRHCKMDEYFVEWQGIWDGDDFVGDGLDAISHRFILNENTRSQFEKAFDEARFNALENCAVIVMDTNKERIYAYGYSEDNFSNADIENMMQDYADEQEADTWEVQSAEYWSEDDCWSARLLCINY